MSLILCPDNGKVFSGPLLPVLVALTFSFYHRGDKTRDYLAQHPPFKIRMPTSRGRKSQSWLGAEVKSTPPSLGFWLHPPHPGGRAQGQ